jgi:hypothetical protein
VALAEPPPEDEDEEETLTEERAEPLPEVWTELDPRAERPSAEMAAAAAALDRWRVPSARIRITSHSLSETLIRSADGEAVAVAAKAAKVMARRIGSILHARTGAAFLEGDRAGDRA